MGRRINSIEVERQMVEEYMNGVSVQSLMLKYGYKTDKSITDKAKKFGYTSEQILELRTKVRKNWRLDFSIISSPFEAYLLGLIATDGWISNNQICLELVDLDCIDFIAKITGKNYQTINRVEQGTTIISKQLRYRVVFDSKKQVENLNSRGIFSNKSKNIKEIYLKTEEEKFYPYLIRGIIDGDGTIGLTSYNKKYFSIVSASEDFMIWNKNILENKLFMKDIKINLENNLYKISSAIERNLEILKILSYSEPLGMNRKRAILFE